MRLRLSFLLLVVSLAANAADLKIKVVDPRSAPVDGAQITLYPTGSSEAVAYASSSAEGTIQLSALNPGEYRIEVLAASFAPAKLGVRVPSETNVEVQLKVARPEQSVIVTATRTLMPADESGAMVEFLDQRVLQELAPVTLPDALRFLPGAVVSIAGQRGGLRSLFVRGGESRYNKVIVDGVPVDEPGGTFDFGPVQMTEIDRLEFLRGPASVLYGSDAMTSVVQMWTATGHTRVPEFRFGADGGTFSSARGFASLEGARGWFDYKAASPRWQNRFLGFEYRHTRLNQDTLADTGCDPPSFNFFDCFFSSPFALNRAGFDYQGDYSPRNWAHTTLGYQWENENASSDSRFLTVDPSGNPVIGISHTRGRRQNHSLYAEEGITRGRISIIAGFRYLHTENFGEASTTSLPVREVSINKVVPQATLTLLAWRGGDVFSGTRLRFTYSEGFKEPRFEEVFGMSGTFPSNPNPNLHPEHNRSLEAGVQQSLLAGKSSLTALFREQIGFQVVDPITFEGQCFQHQS